MTRAIDKMYYAGYSFDRNVTDLAGAIADQVWLGETGTEDKLDRLMTAYCNLVTALEDKGVLSFEDMGLYLEEVDDL